MDNIIRTDYDKQQGDRYRLLPKGDSSPTDPKWIAYNEQLRAQKRKAKQQTGIATTSEEVKPATPITSQPLPVTEGGRAEVESVSLSPKEEILRRAIDEYYIGGDLRFSLLLTLFRFQLFVIRIPLGVCGRRVALGQLAITVALLQVIIGSYNTFFHQ